MLVEHGGVEAAATVAERIVEVLGTPFTVQGTEVSIRGSIGIAVSRRQRAGAEALVRDADVAMYTAKASGKGGVAIFQPHLYTAVVRRHRLKADLQRAVDNGSFVLHYQPICDLGSTDITAIEALIRWRRPGRGLVRPQEFIPLAEETGLILPIGHWVLEQALEEAGRWEQVSGKPAPRLSVNVSTRQVQQPGFVHELADIVAHHDFPASKLTLEITETLMMQDVERTIERLEQIRALGTLIALDDFGTGWSSMAWLREFPVDALKMPKQFLGALGASEDEWEFARAIVTLGHSLELEVVAEGIEHADQVARLRSIGVDAGQGFYFSPPVEADQVPALLGMSTDPRPTPMVRRRRTSRSNGSRLVVPMPNELLRLHPASGRSGV